jgi:Glycosyl hydrolases family 18
MRSLRRPPRPVAHEVDAVVQGVVDLPAPVPGVGAVDPDPVELSPLHLGAPTVIRTGEHGLLIRGSSGPAEEVPALVPWSAVAQASADRVVRLPGGTTAQVVAIEVSEDWWMGEAGTWQFVGPATEIGPLLAAVESGRSALAHPPNPARAARATGASADGAGNELLPVWARHRVVPVLVTLAALALFTGGTASTFQPSAGGSPKPSVSITAGNSAQALAHPSSHLPAATTAPEPAPPSLAGAPPLQSHEVFGYAPYWTLPQSSGFDVKDMTTLAYFSVDANGDGSLDQSGSGWNGYQSQDLVNLVNRAHAAGDRVVLTVTCFSQAALDQITSDPTAAGRLSAALIAAVSAKALDGVNFDFEGEGSADRAGLTALITHVSAALHATNPHWQVSMATYASAAGDSGGFYDVAALAPVVDAFFVMAYDMNDRSQPSPTAPLLAGNGYTDLKALQEFTGVVPAQKIILGVPFYGYDWPTSDGSGTAQATGAETPLSDAVIAASGHPAYWDPVTQTAWTSYLVGTQWHETYFDDPTSLALKAELASLFHIAGVGIWALGMDGNDPAMIAALLGNAPAAKDLPGGPPPPPGFGFISLGTYDGVANLPLTPIEPPPSGGTQQLVGTLSGIGTTDPALTCLQSGPPLQVWTYTSLPGVDVVVASQPTDCATAMWSFSVPPGAAATGRAPAGGSKGKAGSPAKSGSASTSSTSTTTTGPPSTTTTVPPSTTTTTVPTTTTTTTVPPTTTTTGP